MKKIKFILPIMIITVGILGCFSLNTNNTVYAKNIKKIEQISINISKYLDNIVEMQDDKMYLSSPMALMKDNEDYAELVALGIDAIKPLYAKLNSSKESGLMEYIYAMAIQDIMSQNFEYRESFENSNLNLNAKENVTTNDEIDYWSNASEFKVTFSHFMKALPLKYEEIKNDKTLSAEEKEIKIKDLGIGAIPYIVDDIESSESSLNYQSVLNDLLSEKNITTTNAKDWIISNEETIDMVRTVLK